MNIEFALALLSIAFVTGCAAADCYRENGCPRVRPKENMKNGAKIIGQRWKSKSNPCFTCKCIKTKKYVLACLEAIEKAQALPMKKSKFTAKFGSPLSYAPDEDRKISMKERKTKRCPASPEPVYNWLTGTFEPVKIVYYYYIEKFTRCCNRFSRFSYVHPSCKVVKISKCKAKVVKKDNPKERCKKSMARVG